MSFCTELVYIIVQIENKHNTVNKEKQFLYVEKHYLYFDY